MNKLYFIALILTAFPLFGQEDDGLYDHSLDEKKWEEIRDGIRYEGQKEGAGRQWTYESDKEYREDDRKNGNGSGYGNGNGSGNDGAEDYRDEERQSPPPRVQRPRSSNTSFGAGLGVFGYILIGIFAVGLIFIIFYLFVNAETKGSKISQESIVLEEMNPTEIPLTELQRLLQEALAKQDFRGAVRIYFIFIVRGLVQKNWINWQKEKTNFHYLIEMSGKSEYDDFNKSVSYFEVIWYGKRELDATKFEKIKPVFTQFLDKLGIK